MITRYVIPALGLLGLVFAVLFTTTFGNAKPPPPNQLTLPPSTPYLATVSGTGLVEANTRNIEVGSHLSGIVERVLVTEGQEVEAGVALFVLDQQAALVETTLREREVQTAQARLVSARVAVEDEEDQLRRVESMKAGLSVSIDQLQRRRFALKRARAAAEQAQAELQSARAALDAARVSEERLTVRAPVAGRILKVRVRPGEFVSAGGQGDAPVLMGNDRPLYLRVTIDENDAWRFQPNSKAMAALRSNKEISFPLTFVRIDPYVQPKKNLSGDTAERVDTRVLEVVYRIEQGNTPLYIGQQMDVFVESGGGQ